MAISLFSVRDISCHAYHALTLCDVARRARFSILSFIETKYKVNRTENENDFWAIKQL